MSVATNNIGEVTIKVGTAAERAALSATIAGKGVEFWETTGDKYRSNGTSWYLFEAGGVKVVNTTGAFGVAQDRVLAVTADFTVGTRFRQTWLDAGGNFVGPRAILITITGGTAVSKFLFNEPDTGVADATFLVAAGSQVNLPYKRLTPSDIVEKRIFTFSNRLGYLDFIAGAAATEVEILGV